jgi:RHS repeat-associated protein
MTSIYSYDANGNRIAHITAAGVDSGTYDAQDRMLRYAGTEYLYTRNGDLQTKISGTDTTKYTYDTFGNLTQVVMPPVPSGNGDVIQYVIDGQNRRIAKKVNGRIVDKWLYAGQLTPVAELDSANNIIARFSGEYMNRKDTVFQMISDYLGCVRLVVNVNTGAIAQKLDYDEFGNVIYDSNPGFQPFGFGGGLYDNDTKLVRYGERDYDPRVGRWIHKDPVGFEDGYDVYAYCENDPINQIDPTGLQTWPGSGRVTSGFGYRVHPITGERRFHNGIDIANPVRAPVLSTEGGTVISTATGPNGEDQIIIRNDDGSISGYAHTDPSVTVGQHVYEGEPIGVTDLSGLSTGGHVHYTYRSAKGQPHTNPLYHLPKANNYHRLLPCHNGFKGSSSGTSFWNSLVTYLRVQLGV